MIESKEQSCALKDNRLVVFMLCRHIARLCRKPTHPLLQHVHLFVPKIQMLVTEVRVVHETPLPPGMMIALLVANPWEVQPLGMTKLVSDEVQPTLSTQSVDKEPDHLVQGNPSLDNGGTRKEAAHPGVHLLVHQPEGHGLVPHQRLVMTLSIADASLLISPVCEGVHNVPHAPVLVLQLLQVLDPHVRHSHGEPVVKAGPPLLQGPAQGRHAAHVLGNRNSRFGKKQLDEVVGEHQIHKSVAVCPGTKVFVVVSGKACAQSMVGVQHAGHPIKSESVKAKVFNPKTKVREEETKSLPVAVVK